MENKGFLALANDRVFLPDEMIDRLVELENYFNVKEPNKDQPRPILAQRILFLQSALQHLKGDNITLCDKQEKEQAIAGVGILLVNTTEMWRNLVKEKFDEKEERMMIRVDAMVAFVNKKNEDSAGCATCSVVLIIIALMVLGCLSVSFASELKQTNLILQQQIATLTKIKQNVTALQDRVPHLSNHHQIVSEITNMISSDLYQFQYAIQDIQKAQAGFQSKLGYLQQEVTQLYNAVHPATTVWENWKPYFESMSIYYFYANLPIIPLLIMLCCFKKLCK